MSDGILARALPVNASSIDDRTGNTLYQGFDLDDRLDVISETFGRGLNVSPFRRAGVMQESKVYTLDVDSSYDGPANHLGDILKPHGEVDESFFIPEDQLANWSYLKGAKNEPRTHRESGTEYVYSEGAIAFPDPLDKPSWTILTGEGGPSPSRFKHVIKTPDGRYRRLTPVEMESLNGFPEGWTEGITDGRRAFLMGNALVVGIVAKISVILANAVEEKAPTPFSYRTRS
jgi:DNA (cytosine-5)-methyltransferase 1